MYDEASEVGPRGTFETYRAEGEGLYKNGEYRKAIESFTTALELQQGNKDCLVARSRCYLQLGDTDNALKDAETSLSEDKEFHKGLYQKAEALYCQGEFELALVFYHRGHKLRPELQEFRLGIQKAQEAIDNSVGSPEKVKLTKEGDLSFFEKMDEKKVKPKYQSSYSRPSRSKTASKRVPAKRSAQNDKTIKQLLGELYGDKIYLEKLLKETDPTTESGRTIYDLVCEGLDYLDTRTDFWRQQKPMYARKRDKQMQRARRNASNKTAPDEYIIKELEKIDEAQADGQYQDSLKRAKKCLGTVENYAPGTITNKEDVIANLHSQMGNAYLELGQYKNALESHQKDLNMAEENSLEEAQSRALDNLGRVYARMGEFSKAIDSWTKKLPMSKSALEQTWLYHEIGRCHLELKHYSDAREYGEKSVAAANSAKDDMWQLNATVLVAQAEVKLNDLQPALQSFEKALDMAKIQGDKAAEAAITKAVNDVNNKIAEAVKNSPPADDVEEKEHTKEAEEPKETGEEPEQGLEETEKSEPTTARSQESEEHQETTQNESAADAEAEEE